MYAPATLLAVPFLTGAAAGFLFTSQLQQTPEILLAGAALLALVAAIGSCAIGDRLAASAVLAIAALLAGVSLGLTDARRIARTPLLAWSRTGTAGATVTLHGV